MTRRIILFAAFALAASNVFAADKSLPKMEMRLYSVCSDVVGVMTPTEQSQTNRDGVGFFGEHGVKNYLVDRGVSFPVGADVSYNNDPPQIFMRNTRENHSLLRKILAATGKIPTNVELDFCVVTFDPADIEAAARKNKSAAPTQEQVLDLWKSGKGKLEATQKISTRSGVNAMMQSVDEVIYPTQFDPEDTSPTNAAPRKPVEHLLAPCSFETREVGTLVNVTPTVGPDGKTIDLILAPEISDPDSDDITISSGSEGNTKDLTVRQPRFHTNKVTTSIAVRDGETCVMGGMANRANDGWRYFFITARIVDASGGKPGETDDSILLDDGSTTPAK